MDRALSYVGQLATSIAPAFSQAAGDFGTSGAAGLMLAVTPEDGLAASLIANRVANDLHRTVVLAVDGQHNVNICPD
jgi:hypothetical protein